MPSNLNRSPAISLLGNGKLHTSISTSPSQHVKAGSEETTYLDTLTLRQTDPRLLPPNHKHVALPRRKLIVNGILDMHNIEPSVVALPVRNHAHTTHVAAASRHGDDARVEVDEVCDLARREVDLDGVVDADGRVRVADTGFFASVSCRFLAPSKCKQISSIVHLSWRAFDAKVASRLRSQNSVQRLIDGGDLRPSIMRNQEWDSPFAQLHALDFGELVLGLLGCDAVDGEAAFGVVDEAEVLARLFDGDDVHEAGGVGCVGADFAVDFD